MGLLPRRALQLLCAALSGLFGSAGMMWSACHGSFGFAPIPHR